MENTPQYLKFTPEVLREGMSRGLSQVELAKEHGKSQSVVQDALKYHDVKWVRTNGLKRKRNSKDLAPIKYQGRTFESKKLLSDYLGISYDTLIMRLRSNWPESRWNEPQRKFKVDFTGREYGRLTVIREAPKRGDKRAWFCECNCENTELKAIPQTHLVTGAVQSCGCLFREMLSETKTDFIEGNEYGYLTVLTQAESDSEGKAMWICKCSLCGKESHPIRGRDLRSGNTTTCGCSNFEDGVLQFLEKPERADKACWLYLVEVDNVVDEVGIAFDIYARGREHYTHTWWKKEMDRASCWAVEQVALELTKEFSLSDDDHFDQLTLDAGTSECRFGINIDDTILLLEELSEQCLKEAWFDFYKNSVV